MNNKGRWMSGIGMVILASIVIYCIWMSVPDIQAKMSSEATARHVYSVIRENRKDESLPFTREAWEVLHEENPDFIGYLMFQSGIIQEPVVRSHDNEDYLNVGFNGEYDSSGTVFLESSASLDSRNMTLFGHYVYYDSTMRFTPLELLTDQQGYEDNQVVHLFLEDGMRTYLVSSVLFITEEEAEYYDYSCPDPTQEDFREWTMFINVKNLIDPIAGSADENDRLLTLQTCKKWDPSQRQLVICREISRTDW